MQANDLIKHRIEQIRQRIETYDFSQTDACVCNEINMRICTADSILEEKMENGNSNDSPLSLELIMFNLDRCEELLLYSFSINHYGGEKLTCKDWLYPTLWESVIEYFFSRIVNIRGHLLGYKTGSDTFGIRNVLYVKSPFWLEPIMRQFLPKDDIKKK
ncbi:MAG: hypothetical protein ABIK92_13235 [Pseudomonadota bacterium]